MTENKILYVVQKYKSNSCRRVVHRTQNEKFLLCVPLEGYRVCKILGGTAHDTRGARLLLNFKYSQLYFENQAFR
jgi:hypothetical protein